MPKISVIGLGNWGTALANHLAMKGNEVLGWTIDPGVPESINDSHRNSRYQSDIQLDEKLRATDKLEDVLDAEMVLLATPSAAMAEVIPKLKLKDSACLISAVKGLEMESRMTPLQFAETHLPNPCRLCVLSGPSFAKDLVAAKPVSVTAASKDESTAKEVADLFSNEWMKVYVSTDVTGVELGGILKNVIALAAGVADGMELGESATAALITRGLAEITRLGVALGAEQQTFFGLSGMGDLVLTASCDTSRNRTVGLRLGRGESLGHIIETLGSVAEGVRTTPIVMDLAKETGVEVPITEQVARLIAAEATPDEMLRALITRPVKREF